MSEHRYALIQGCDSVRRIALQNELNAPIEEIWQAVTQVERIQKWWPDWRPGGVVEPREGGRIKLDDGSWINGVVKVWQPPHIFEFTWHESIDSGVDWFEQYTRSLLRIDLVSIGESKTLLNLVQFAPEGSVIGGTAGWHHFVGERLTGYIDRGTLEDDPKRFAQLKLLYDENS